MLKIIRYLLALLLILFIIVISKNDKSKLKILKIIFNVFIASVIIIMPFENLILKFDSPEQAFKYAVNSNIINTIENENSSLVIYNNSGDIKATIINKYNEKWKAPFLPDNQKLSRLEDNSIILITKERKSNNFYIMISANTNINYVYDNKGSVFDTFSINDKQMNFVAYVENCNSNYIINIDENEHKIL